MEIHAPPSAVRFTGEPIPTALSAPTASAVRWVVEAYEAGRLVQERLAQQMVLAVQRAFGAPSLPRLATELAREVRARRVELSVTAYLAQSAHASRRDD